MGNSSQSQSSGSRDQKKRMSTEQIRKNFEQMIQDLQSFCRAESFPLNILIDKTDILDQQSFLDIVLCSTRIEDFNSYIIDLIFKYRSTLSKQDLNSLIGDVCFFDIKQNSIDCDSVQRENLDQTCFTSLTNSICKTDATSIDKDSFLKWIRENFITFFHGFETWLRRNCGKSKDLSSQVAPSASSKRPIMSMDNILNSTWVWLLSHHLPINYLSVDNACTTQSDRMDSVLHGKMWDHLYNSHKDGASLNRFQHHIFGYNGPMLMLFESSDNYLFCLCCDEKFIESPKHFGGTQSLLIQLKPVFKIVIEGPKIIFMNTKLRGLSAMGLFVGRDHSHVFMEIDTDFFNIKHLNGQGRLVAIDVWGVGGKSSAEAQMEMRQWEQKQIEKSKKVNINYAEEEAILNMAGIETRHTQDQF